MISSDYLGSGQSLIKSIDIQETSLINQPVLSVSPQPILVKKIYHKNQLIGVLTSEAALESFLQQIYEEKYKGDFPDTKLGLGADIFITSEESYMTYDNADQQIFDYLAQQSLFSVQVYKIKFSNGAIIYVKNTEMFNQAKEQYLLNFISSNTYELLKKKQLPPELSTYGTREIGLNVVETAEYSQAMASVNEILKNKSEIIYFLSYGYNDVLKTYTVKTYDTIQYIAYLSGMTAQQLISINSDVLKSENQILVPGTVLNVSYFDSPLSVVVTKERFASEIVYPQTTLYVKDNTIREGLSVVKTHDRVGSKNVKYIEKYVNGVLVESTLSSSVITNSRFEKLFWLGP